MDIHGLPDVFDYFFLRPEAEPPEPELLRPVSPLPGFGIDSFWVVLGWLFAYFSVTKVPLTESRYPG